MAPHREIGLFFLLPAGIIPTKFRLTVRANCR
jgi:hypothetical protein